MLLPDSRSNALNYLDSRLARRGKEEVIRGKADKTLGLCLPKTPWQSLSGVPLLVISEPEVAPRQPCVASRSC